MALNVHKPATRALKKPQLSRLGKVTVILMVVLVLAVAGGIIASGVRSSREAERAKPVQEAIDHAMLRYRQAMQAGNLTAEMNETVDRINSEPSIVKKAGLAQEAVTRALVIAKGDQALTDELNGSLNRILLALRDYGAIVPSH